MTLKLIAVRGLSICFALAFSSALAVASPISGQVTGTFSDPVAIGSIIGVNGNLIPTDNTGTAVPGGTNGPVVSTFEWGNTDPDSGFISSLLGFIGNNLSGQAPNEPFVLGTLIYRNGSSALDSMLFGANFKISIPSDPTVEVLNINLALLTTENDLSSPQHDADYITFSGLDLTLSAFEGKTISALLWAMIVGDPQLFLTDITLFGPADVNNGFIGTTPVPATLPLFAAGLGVMAFLARRRKQKAQAAA